jgi:hypothetical protein
MDRETGGRICEWKNSSRLTVSRVFPAVGRRLMAHVLDLWPVRLESVPEFSAGEADISILVAIGGADRLRQFEIALKTFRAQTGVRTEVVVVEQSPMSLLSGSLPADVRFVHQATGVGEPFNKSRALNAAARLASAEHLLLVDADFLLPTEFAAQCHRALLRVEAVRPARLVFYFDEPTTRVGFSEPLPRGHLGLDSITANTPMPIAVTAAAYWAIGGHDESYVGWGGEDLEFLDRLRTRRLAEGGWMPLFHLWHLPAAKKASGDRNQVHHDTLMSRPAPDRIAALTSRHLASGGSGG